MESPSEDSWREFFTKTPEFKARMSTCNSFRNNLVSLYTGEFGENIRRWLPLAFLNYKTEFKNEALLSVVQSEYSDGAVNAFARSRNGDCCAYLLRFCLLLIGCRIVTEEDLVLVEGQSLTSDNKGSIQRIVQVVETQIYRAGNA
ncbi:hypothetical protein MP638_000198 [Amoeboaphelidium occidentale]|nr:hypothetical protein MP638_000198 [Amoeboaphelidium occidentale]